MYKRLNAVLQSRLQEVLFAFDNQSHHQFELHAHTGYIQLNKLRQNFILPSKTWSGLRLVYSIYSLKETSCFSNSKAGGSNYGQID